MERPGDAAHLWDQLGSATCATGSKSIPGYGAGAAIPHNPMGITIHDDTVGKKGLTHLPQTTDVESAGAGAVAATSDRSNKSTGAALSACGPACHSVGCKWLRGSQHHRSTARDVAPRAED